VRYGITRTVSTYGDLSYQRYQQSRGSFVNGYVWSSGLLYLPGGDGLEAITPAGSVVDPGSSPAVMTVGAYNINSGGLEAFSSQGPTIDGRRKPDIAGPDGVSNDVFSPTFSGTSASAPHGTGAAALVKQKIPSATPAQIQTFLECRALDSGPPGADNQFGYGKLRLGAVPTAQDLAAGVDCVAVAVPISQAA